MLFLNLKDRFRFVIISMTALVVSIIVILSIGIRHSNDHIQESISMDDLVINLYELRLLNYEYVASPTERVKQQWQVKFAEIKSIVSAQNDLPDDIKEALNGHQQMFSRLVSLSETAADITESQMRLKNQVATALNLESQRIVDWASEISRQSKDMIISHLKNIGALLLTILVMVALVTITTMYITARRISTSVVQLKEGAEKIATGNLGFQVEIAGNDEIASLATSVNQMSRSLMNSYAELRDQTVQLEDEMAERQKIHEALQSKTAELEEEVAERQVTQQNLEEQTAILEEEIAERTRIQENHTRLEEQLLQSQKMEAIGLLAGGIAHDFNNILSVIMGYGEMLSGGLPDGKMHNNAIQILNATERAADLTRGLLAFSRKQTFNLERTDINKLASDNGKFLSRLIGEDIELVTEYYHAPLYALLDRSQIQQVLMNLATNARDAMPAGGTLTISISAETADEGFIAHHVYIKPGVHAVIRVTDTGIGMDSCTVERIFEPFYTTKEKGKGTGLGLSIIHGIIAQHNGFIECSSERGSGSTFMLHFPLCDEEECVAASVATTNPQRPRGTETILIAEDDDSLLELFSGYLEENGYRVIQAHDGAEAVQLFTLHAAEIDLVVLDAIMPKMTGKQAWDEIKPINPEVKVCFVSGYANEIISGKIAIDYSAPFISKPFLPDQLLLKLREILDA